MRYYISGLKAIEKGKLNKIRNANDINFNTECFLLIFSLDGIFKLNNNSIQKRKIKDKPIISKPLGNYIFLEDNSEYTYDDISQIPLEHFCKKIRQETFMLREKAKIKLIVVIDDINDDIIDFYFDSTITIDNEFIIEDLLHFMDYVV